MRLYYFEKLDVWQNSKELSIFIYKVTQSFPSEEKFGLTNQLRRAATSICANIAEGTGRATGKETKRFINIAYSSTLEVLNFVIIAFELGYLSEDDFNRIRNKIEHITNQLHKLQQSIKTN